MRRLFIIRHGKTQWNLAHRLQGAGADSPLLTNDPQPFQQLAGYLDQYAFAAAYTSPLTRAYDTATLTLGYFTRHPRRPYRCILGCVSCRLASGRGALVPS
ncbi:histidine phosphatase family protein [Lacticaseibacillus nasuensis]|uniref:histidine phosphatase family protein n=1 Tax=Lacticaseibacillus nasuensis TaxID=944671 RepID=UPI0006D131AA